MSNPTPPTHPLPANPTRLQAAKAYATEPRHVATGIVIVAALGAAMVVGAGMQSDGAPHRGPLVAPRTESPSATPTPDPVATPNVPPLATAAPSTDPGSLLTYGPCENQVIGGPVNDGVAPQVDIYPTMTTYVNGIQTVEIQLSNTGDAAEITTVTLKRGGQTYPILTSGQAPLFLDGKGGRHATATLTAAYARGPVPEVATVDASGNSCNSATDTITAHGTGQESNVATPSTVTSSFRLPSQGSGVTVRAAAAAAAGGRPAAARGRYSSLAL